MFIVAQIAELRLRTPSRRAGGDGVGIGQNDVVGDSLARRDIGQRQAELGLQGQQAASRKGAAECKAKARPLIERPGFRVHPGLAAVIWSSWQPSAPSVRRP